MTVHGQGALVARARKGKPYSWVAIKCALRERDRYLAALRQIREEISIDPDEPGVTYGDIPVVLDIVNDALGDAP